VGFGGPLRVVRMGWPGCCPFAVSRSECLRCFNARRSRLALALGDDVCAAWRTRLLGPFTFPCLPLYLSRLLSSFGSSSSSRFLSSRPPFISFPPPFIFASLFPLCVAVSVRLSLLLTLPSFFGSFCRLPMGLLGPLIFRGSFPSVPHPSLGLTGAAAQLISWSDLRSCRTESRGTPVTVAGWAVVLWRIYCVRPLFEIIGR